ncbi:MAG: tRNA 2-thiocytidine(32) synthetase TtcA [Myxococcota bacterium]|nr:tRNA 2-thiocytidine(32) synthetase TtcA [Myxococcota bacterium]
MKNQSEDIETLRRRLTRRMMRTIKGFQLIEPGDKIMVGVSGGKDSYTMLDLLCGVQKRSPFKFELIAVHLDQNQPGYDGRPLENWLENFNCPYEIVRQDTYSVVLELTKPGGTFCAPCSRLRRGILYTTAERLGCNKIALGHHRDDTLETVMMNMFFSGKLQAMPPVYTTDDGRFQVIRPLIECAENDIETYSQKRAFPILPCNLCGSQAGLQRVKMGDLLDQLEEQIPNVRDVMLASLKNVRPTHLLDPTLSSSRTTATDLDTQACKSSAEDGSLVSIDG